MLLKTITTAIILLYIPLIAKAESASTEVAIFAGGCFWCVESDFDQVPGVLETTSGYIGGNNTVPTYRSVSAGNTGYAEAVKIQYDPSVVSYKDLLTYFWRTIDPTVKNQQFCDIGSQYRSEIFYLNEQQEKEALSSREFLKSNKPFDERVVTGISRATQFYPAEPYHQNYYQKNPIRYKYYRWGCGRDQRLTELWGVSK